MTPLFIFTFLGTLADVPAAAVRCRTGHRRGGGPEAGEVEAAAAALAETHLSDDWLSVHRFLDGSGEVTGGGGVRTGLVQAGKILREARWTGNLLAVLAVDDTGE